MDARRLSFGLGIFSIALGLAEVAATRRIARALGNDHRAGRAPSRTARPRKPAGRATKIEPDDMPLIRAPGVTHH